MNLNNQLDPRLGNWINKNLKKAEIILLLIIGIGLALKVSGSKGGNILIAISFSTLAVFYFFRAYTVFENADKMGFFFNKLLSLGWSISTIAIMFLIQGWQGFEPMLVAGAFPQLVILFVVLFLKEKKSIEYKTLDKSVLLRSIVISALAISLYFCPKEALFNSHIISKPHLENSDK